MTRLSLAIVLLALWQSPSHARTVVDSSGRSVVLPERIERVFAAGPPTSVVVYALAPHTLLGWPRALRREERAYIAQAYRDLPETGRLTGRGGEANLEYVLKLKPDLIVDFGSITDTYRSLAERVQQQTGIPYILIDGRFESTPASLRLLGDILGVGARGEDRARYVEQTFAETVKIIAGAPAAQLHARPIGCARAQRRPGRRRSRLATRPADGGRRRCRCARRRADINDRARGPDGLETGLRGSMNTEIIERAGGINAATTDDDRRGLVRASIEQVIVANPDTILTWEPQAYATMLVDPLWAGIDAVRRGRVHLSPTAPFGWIDRPPSLNRVMGLKWLSRLFFPDRFADDLKDTTRTFYRLFYGVDLSEAELETLIQWSRGRAPARQAQ